MPVYDLEPIEDSREGGIVETGGSVESLNIPEGAPEKKPEVAKENSYETILEQAKSQAQSATGNVKTSVSDDVSTISGTDEETRIQKLVNVAMEKGPEHAFKVAIELDDMYALDILHDRLSHQLYQELVTKGLLKEK